MNLTIKHFCSFVLLMLSCACSQNNIPPGSDDKPLLIINANVVDVVNERIIYDQELLIENGRISAIASTVDKSNYPSARVEDIQGGFVLPGLIDMHVHGYDKSAFEISLSHGVTHVRVMNGVNEHLDWREQQQSGEWLASSMTVSSPIIRGGEKQPLSWLANTPEQARALVQQAKSEGFDLLKAYGSLNASSLEALIDEANKLDLPIAKHGPHPAGNMSWHKLSHLQSLEHAEDIYQGPLAHRFDNDKLQAVLNEIKELQTPVTPTLNIFWQLTRLSNDKDAYLETLATDYISPIIAFEDTHNQVNRWLTANDKMAEHNQKTFEFLKQITKSLADNHIPVLVGSDAGVLLSPHGLATLNEMKLMSDAGMSPFAVIRSATCLPARALGKEKEIGEVREGFKADLLVLPDNPTVSLDYLYQPDAVIKNGVWLSQANLTTLRDNARQEQRLWQEFTVLWNNY